MKKQVFLFLALGFLYSCDKDDDKSTDKGLIGNWKLIEVLADPGDGSGTFAVVESNKIITFQQNGIITSNGTLERSANVAHVCLNMCGVIFFFIQVLADIFLISFSKLSVLNLLCGSFVLVNKYSLL